jgi:hypothetical protein
MRCTALRGVIRVDSRRRGMKRENNFLVTRSSGLNGFPGKQSQLIKKIKNPISYYILKQASMSRQHNILTLLYMQNGKL